MTPAIALLDANVLYPAPLRDLLMQLAFAGVYQARWSARIDEEWTRNLLAARPTLAERIARTQAIMHRVLPDALVTDYEKLIPGLSLPDPDDRHVLAAAITALADVVVTCNVRDFPVSALAPLGLVAWHPDDFLQSLINAVPFAVLSAVRECVGRLRQPALSEQDYLLVLHRLGLTRTVVFLNDHLEEWRRR